MGGYSELTRMRRSAPFQHWKWPRSCKLKASGRVGRAG